MRGILFLFLIVFVSYVGRSQQLVPADGAVLTTTSVLLEVPEVVGANVYEYHIQASNGTIIERSDDNHVLRTDGLTFGESYTWKVDALDKKGAVLHTYNQSFRIATSSLVDPEQSRFPVFYYEGNKKTNGLLLLDYNRVAINSDGIPVWFMPELERIERGRLRDVKLTSRGTITYLDIFNCEEMSLDGTSIWNTPSTGAFSGDTSDYYHHEFTRLSNGNYMVLAKQYVSSDLVINGKQIGKLPLSIIIEYSPENEAVWTWSSNRYVKDSDILQVGQKVGMGNTFGHMNSFYFDEPTGILYAGFRDLNCILAIEKESGNVIQSYGDKIPSDTSTQAIGFFRKQHAPIPISGGRLLLFNNNDRKKPSSVQIISEVTMENANSELLWEFTCDFDTLRPAESPRMGNALPLNDGHVLVNMGKAARIFEVSPEKQVVWQCLPEKWNENTQAWQPQPNYRVFHTSSLYPFYHTISLREKKIHISNEGSENDRYTIQAYYKPRKRKKSKVINFELESGESIDFELVKLFNRKLRSKTVFIEVRSENNPDLVVKRSYLLKK